MAFYPTLQKSWRAFLNNIKSVIMIIVIDIIFFVCMAFVYAKVWQNAMVHINAILDIAGMSMEELAGAQTEAQLSSLMAKQAEFMAHYRQISYYVGMLLVALLVFWCVFQGISWLTTHNIIKGKKYNAMKYFGRFSLLSIIWWAAFILLMGGAIRMSMYSSMAVLPFFSRLAARTLVLLLLFVLFSVSYTSYALVPEHSIRRVFREIVAAFRKKYKAIVPAYLFMAAVLVGEYFFFMRAFALGGYAPAVFAVVIIFPTIAWTRFYAITALEK